MKIKGAIFDADGTLLDSMPVWKHLCSDYLRAHGITPKEGLEETLKAMSVKDGARYCATHYALPCTPEEMAKEINDGVLDFYENKVQLKSGVRETLRTLHDAGVRMCVATASEEAHIRAALSREDVLSYFQNIFTCVGVGASKERPDIYEAALACLQTPRGETMVFEDALTPLLTAGRAGFLTAAVYDEASQDKQTKIKAAADVYFLTFDGAYKKLL